MSVEGARPAPGPVVIRRAEPDDAVAIAELQDAANEGQLSKGVWGCEATDWRAVGARQIRKGRTEMALAATLVASTGDGVVGMLNYAANDAPPDLDDPVSAPFVSLRGALGPCLYLRALAVRPSFGGRGIATRLLDVATIAADRVASGVIGVIVHESNGRLIGHYAGRGFAEVAREPVRSHVAYPPGSMLLALRRTRREDA